MDDTVQGLLQYGYVLLFAFVLAEQVGLPVPAVPVLLGVGALAGGGRMSLTLAFAAALAASLPPDVIWYELGRRRGARVLGLLCRISLDPDSCVQRTENLFMRRGRKALLIAKFFPGLSTVAPPLAGMVGIARWQFPPTGSRRHGPLASATCSSSSSGRRSPPTCASSSSSASGFSVVSGSRRSRPRSSRVVSTSVTRRSPSSTLAPCWT